MTGLPRISEEVLDEMMAPDRNVVEDARRFLLEQPTICNSIGRVCPEPLQAISVLGSWAFLYEALKRQMSKGE